MAQSLEPEDVDGDIYDEISNLEKWQTMLSDLIATNSISQEEFDSEMLKTRYYIDIKTKTYVLDDDDAVIIENLRKYKDSLTENYKYGTIDESEFNREYNNILRKEYDILKMSENEETESRGSLVILDLPMNEKLQKLHEAEIKNDKSIAKKHGILFPNLPPGVTKEQVNRYHDLKITGQIENGVPEIEDYLTKYAATKQMIGYYTSSYEVTRIFYNSETKTPNYDFKMVAPMSNKLRDITVLEKRSNLLSPEEQAYSDRLNILKNRLRQMSRSDLLKCAGVRTLKYMSYIERLKENKQNVIRFKNHPDNYKLLQQIIEEDNIYYNIPSDQLFKKYVYTRPDIFAAPIEENETDIVEYLEQGNTGYLAIKEGADLKNLGEGLENFVTILPLQDDLYTNIKTEAGNQSEIAQAWELRMSLPGSNTKNVVKRYLSFDDYLTEFREILVDNSKFLTGKSKDVLNSKIRKINYYLKYGEDPESYLPTGHTSVSELFKNRTQIYSMRQEGLYNLLELFTTYYPGCDTLVEKIETDIFEYSSKNYKFNISKIKFLINNHQEKLNDLITGDESIINLLTYETPRILPEEDIDITGDKQENINKLLKWRPDTSFYDIYKTELERDNYRFYKFKKEHPELTNLQISQLMSEYSEDFQWKKSLDNYRKLVVPDGYIELNYRLRYLLKQRNKIPSRRIFKLAKISDRIYSQQKFLSTFTKCKIPEPKEYSVLTESIIYGLAKTPEEYSYYINLVNSEYKKLCEFFTKVNLKCQLDSSGTVKCILSFEPNVLTPIITEFLITQGEFNTVDIQRLKNFTENVNSSKLISYIQNLRGDEINSYNSSIMEQVNRDPTPLNEIYLKAARIMKTAKMRKQLDELANVANNIYKPPIVVVEKPVKFIQGREYIPEYIKVGDYYVYGGFYPMFNTYGNDGSVIKENYTRYDLEQLASIYNLDLLEDSFELYKSIMQFMYNYNKKEIIVEEINFNPIEYNKYYEYLKTPIKTINYTIRPRVGVKEPGEVYTVIKDQVRLYGVPFSFNEHSIPIYSEELKERVDNGYIIIEGPCIFQKTDSKNIATSDSYINVEYKDSRGKSKLFREGVSSKKILKKQVDSLNTCNRFITKASCDDPNSYSLDVNGLKFKCKWLKEKCKGVIVESDELKNFDINSVKFKNFSKNKLWITAVDKSIKYVEELTKLKGLTQVEINTLALEQKLRLLKYYKNLIPKQKLRTIPEEKLEVKSYSIIDNFGDLLKPIDNVTKPEQNITGNYTSITIYNLTSTTMKMALKIIPGKEYTVNGNVVIPKEYDKDDNSYICEIKESGEIIALYPEEFRKNSEEIVTKPVPLFCLIKNEDLFFMNNLPGYYYYLKTIIYLPENDEIIKKEEISKMTTVPSNFITPSSLLNGKPLVTRADILEAVANTAFSKLTTDGGFIYDIIEKVNAEKDAVEFAVKNKIDINEMFTRIIGTVTLVDVIEEYEKINPKKIMSKTELTNIIQEAIENKNKSKIAEYFVRGKKSKIDPEILKEAKKLLKELPDVEEVKIVEPPVVKEVPKEPDGNRNIYTAPRRRR
jgi:hypothetical protein